MPTRRTVRVAEVLRKELSALMTHALDLEGMLITISSVELPPDMKQAYIYVSTLNPEVEMGSAPGHPQPQSQGMAKLDWPPPRPEVHPPS